MAEEYCGCGQDYCAACKIKKLTAALSSRDQALRTVVKIAALHGEKRIVDVADFALKEGILPPTAPSQFEELAIQNYEMRRDFASIVTRCAEGGPTPGLLLSISGISQKWVTKE